jgi:phosphonate transport system substrate-binding protein
MLKRVALIFLAAAVIGAMGFCPAAKAESVPQWPATVKIGLIPTEGGADILKRFQPLIEHLQKTLGIKVEGFSASDYAGIITAMTHKHIDFAYFGPKSYTDAADKAGAQAVALEMDKKRQPGYHGVIITKKDSGLKTIEQAKGKTFAFTDPNSTSGFLVPNILFARDLKVKPENFFQKVSFSGSHGASILAVKNGSIAVAATNNIDLDRMAEKGQASWDDFNVIWRSDLIPGSPMCVRKDLPESLKAAFAGALLMFNSNKMGLEKLQNGGYTFADDSTYDVIRYLKRLKSEMAKK